MAQRVKRLKALPAYAPSGPTSYEEINAKRDDLGVAFGTKRAQSRIKAVERNRVDAVAQEKSRDHLMASIGEVNDKLPMLGACAGRRRTEADEADHRIPAIAATTGAPIISRLIPTPDTTTTDPASVYPLDSLISPEAYAAIDVRPFTAKGLAEHDRAQLLPFPGSRWLEAKLRLAVALPSDERKRALWVPPEWLLRGDAR